MKDRKKISPEQIHIWYLEATKKINPKFYNQKAQKFYNELSKEQKSIDRYVANKIQQLLDEQKKEIIKGLSKKFDDGNKRTEQDLTDDQKIAEDGYDQCLLEVLESIKKV